MARAKLSQTSFTGGELSPRVLGHTDVDRYSTGLKQARNMHPVIQGGLKRRPGTLFTAAAATVTPGGSILIPFVQGRGQAWMLEFSNNAIKVFNADGTDSGVTLVTGYSDSMLGELDYAQSDATMYLFSPYSPVARLQRLGDDVWAISDAPFTQEPFAEIGRQDGPFVTLNAATVGVGRTATAGAAYFLAADVGRGALFEAGIGVITAVGSATSATVEITRAFGDVTLPSGLWTLEGSPQATCTPSAKDPVGAQITLTLSLAGWRSTDVGAMVRINGGLCRISAFTSATIVNAVIVRELADVVAAPALAWSLEPTVWGGPYGYPRTGTVHQQRLIVAGSRKFPRTVWGSRVGEPLDFELGTTDDAAFSFTIDSDESSPISYISSAKGIAVFTESGEYSMRGGVERPLTPTNVRIEPESGHGCALVRPANINREILFVQRAGRKVRAYGYRYDFDGFSSVDITALAEHITETGVIWLAYQQEPDQLLWAVRADGKLLTCTIDRDQQPSVIGWALHETLGCYECVATIPNGVYDQVWTITHRAAGGAIVRYIERFDHTFRPILE